jgi:hypothetical protein
MSLSWPNKDPDEVLDYSLNWSARLDGDTIDSVVWSFPAGITKDSQALAGALASVFISGGTDGVAYLIGCRVVTAGGRTMDESVKLKVKTR